MGDPVPTKLYGAIPLSVRTQLRRVLKRFPAVRWGYADNSYLRENGWFARRRAGAPVDGDSEPIPWYSYPFIDFLEPRLDKQFRVFEYGSGNSTRWFASRVSAVVAVEHSGEWVEQITGQVPGNATVVHQSRGEEYVREPLSREPFEIISIDGIDRTACTEPALEALAPKGVVIIDDFERWDDEELALFHDQDFRSVAFRGPKAHRLTGSTTAVMYRDENCLGI